MIKGRQILKQQEDFSVEDKRILDLLDRGLSRDFPNPGRIGCPDSGVLRRMAERKVPLSQADQLLNHLSSCSPCFQDFSKFRAEAARRPRMLRMALAAAAIILIVFGALLWIRTTTPVQTATIDLRERSVARGENPDSVAQSPIELSLGTKHLVFDLPIGSQEGNYEVALLGRSGEETSSTAGIARLENHTVILRADIDLAGVSPGRYFLGIRQAGLAWTRYPLRVR